MPGVSVKVAQVTFGGSMSQVDLKHLGVDGGVSVLLVLVCRQADGSSLGKNKGETNRGPKQRIPQHEYYPGKHQIITLLANAVSVCFFFLVGFWEVWREKETANVLGAAPTGHY